MTTLSQSKLNNISAAVFISHKRIYTCRMHSIYLCDKIIKTNTNFFPVLVHYLFNHLMHWRHHRLSLQIYLLRFYSCFICRIYFNFFYFTIVYQLQILFILYNVLYDQQQNPTLILENIQQVFKKNLFKDLKKKSKTQKYRLFENKY